MKVIMSMIKNMDTENSPGLMVAPTKVSSMRTTLRVRGSTNGPTAESTKESGRTTKWRATVCSYGLMAESTKESTSMIRRKERALSSGQMAVNTKETGRTESSTGSEYTDQLRGK